MADITGSLADDPIQLAALSLAQAIEARHGNARIEIEIVTTGAPTQFNMQLHHSGIGAYCRCGRPYIRPGQIMSADEMTVACENDAMHIAQVIREEPSIEERMKTSAWYPENR